MARRIQVRQEVKNLIVEYLKAGHSQQEVGKKFDVHTSTVYRLGREAGVTFRRNKKLEVESLKKYLAEHPQMLLKEVAEVFNVTAPALCQFLKRNHIVYEKDWRKKVSNS